MVQWSYSPGLGSCAGVILHCHDGVLLVAARELAAGDVGSGVVHDAVAAHNAHKIARLTQTEPCATRGKINLAKSQI